MKKILKLTALLLMLGSVLMVQNALAVGEQSGELKIIDNSNSNFEFMGFCGNGVVIHGDPNIKSQGNFTFQIAGANAKGEIGYLDSKYQQVIDFYYDYTQPGGSVTVKGGDQYYQFTGYRIPNGNEIVITDKK